MTQKHFIALANLIKTTPVLQSTDAVNAITAFCAASNPKFDARRFIKAATGILINGNQLPSN